MPSHASSASPNVRFKHAHARAHTRTRTHAHTHMHTRKRTHVPAPRQVVGVVVAVGEGVPKDGLRPGDRAGVGWISGSCRTCAACLRGEENVCESGYTGLIVNGGLGVGRCGRWWESMLESSQGKAARRRVWLIGSQPSQPCCTPPHTTLPHHTCPARPTLLPPPLHAPYTPPTRTLLLDWSKLAPLPRFVGFGLVWAVIYKPPPHPPHPPPTARPPNPRPRRQPRRLPGCVPCGFRLRLQDTARPGLGRRRAAAVRRHHRVLATEVRGITGLCVYVCEGT